MAFKKNKKWYKESEEKRLAEELRKNLYLDMPVPDSLSPSAIVSKLQETAAPRADEPHQDCGLAPENDIILLPPATPSRSAYQRRQKITSLIACAACVALCIGIGLPALLSQKKLKSDTMSSTMAGEIGGSGHFSPENDSEKESINREDTSTTPTVSRKPTPSSLPPSVQSSAQETESAPSSDEGSTNLSNTSSSTTSLAPSSTPSSIPSSDPTSVPPSDYEQSDTSDSSVNSEGNSIITSSNSNAAGSDAPSSEPSLPIYGIDADAVRLKMTEGTLLIDVRETEEFTLKHIPNAVNIPLTRLSDSIADYATPPEDIIVYCETGVRSAQAAEMLALKGYVVYDLGGIGTDWPYDTVTQPQDK